MIWNLANEEFDFANFIVDGEDEDEPTEFPVNGTSAQVSDSERENLSGINKHNIILKFNDENRNDNITVVEEMALKYGANYQFVFINHGVIELDLNLSFDEF